MANLHTMLLSFFILIFSTTTAQTKNSISGKVIDYKLRSPILNAIIIINDNNRVVYKTNSDTLGNFSIPLDKLEKVTNLTIESQNYFKLTLSDKDLALSEIHLMTKKNLAISN